MSRFSKIAGILAITAILFAGCSKSSGPTSASSTNAPKLAAPVFKGPGTSATGADTSFGALTVNGLAATFTSVSAGYSALFAQAGAPKQSGSTWTWSINGSGYTITFSATQSDTTYQWKDVINGNYQGTSYSNWTAFTGSETESGANGDWTLYNQNKATLFAKVNWTTDASGNLTGNIATYDSTGAQSGKYVFVDNKDNSGSLEEYTTGTTPILKVVWTSSGTGQWWEYDDQGNQTASGTWS